MFLISLYTIQACSGMHEAEGGRRSISSDEGRDTNLLSPLHFTNTHISCNITGSTCFHSSLTCTSHHLIDHMFLSLTSYTHIFLCTDIHIHMKGFSTTLLAKLLYNEFIDIQLPKSLNMILCWIHKTLLFLTQHQLSNSLVFKMS